MNERNQRDVAQCDEDAGMPAEPIRMCVICRKRFPKRELLRHVCPVLPDGDGPKGLVPDPDNDMPGRGFYVCDDATCRQRFEKFSGWRRKCKGV